MAYNCAWGKVTPRCGIPTVLRPFSAIPVILCVCVRYCPLREHGPYYNNRKCLVTDPFHLNLAFDTFISGRQKLKENLYKCI